VTFDQILQYLTTIGALLLAYLGWRRNDKGDTSAQAEWRGRVSTMLEAIMEQLKGLVGIPERVRALEDWQKQHMNDHQK
jgi:hypothetical protein